MPDIIGRRRPGLAYFYDGFINMPEYYNCRLVISFVVEFFATTDQGYALISHEPLQLET